MADIAFTCPECGHAYQFASHMGGKRGRCKACQAVFRIPAPTTTLASAPPAQRVPASAAPASRPASVPPALPPVPVHAADASKIVFNCPTCGHGYRLDVKLAGKQGRCTTCRGVFMIPARSAPSSAASTDAAPSSSVRARGLEPERPARIAVAGSASVRAPSVPAAARPSAVASRRATKPPAAVPPATAAGDSGWWELDSSESIPAATAQAGAGRARGSAAVATSVAALPVASGRAGLARRDPSEAPIATARPVRPKWVTYAAIAASVLLGGITFTIAYSLVSNETRSGPPPIADQSQDQPEPTTSPGSVAEAVEPSTPTVPQPGGSAARHREAVDALIRAYNDIADGYARIRDVDSIAEGKGLISRGVDRLKQAAQRGRSLPPLSPPDREDVIRRSGPSLLQAVERVLGELRRLRSTPGLRSDFDRLIDAYTRTRQEIQRELEQR